MVAMETQTDRMNLRLRWAILVGGALVILAMTYGSGMRAQKKKLEKQGNELKIARQELRATQLTLQGRDLLLQQWEARRQVDRALVALEARNFGTARERLNEAAGRLEAVAKVRALNVAALEAVPAALKAVPLEAMPNVEAPRSALLAIARRMDAELDKVVPKPDTLSAVTVQPPTANDVPLYPEIGR